MRYHPQRTRPPGGIALNVDRGDALVDHDPVRGVSSGMGVVAVGEVGSALAPKGRSSLPKLVPVQQESCAPMARAWLEGAESIGARHVVKNPRGIAEAILRGDPSASYPIARRWVQESGGKFMMVTEAEIVAAIRLLREKLDVHASASGATALAGAFKAGQEGLFGEDDIVLVNITGGETNGERT